MSIKVVEHLGDGAYVTITNDEVILTANHHDPELATDVVHLDNFAVGVLFQTLKNAGVKLL